MEKNTVIEALREAFKEDRMRDCIMFSTIAPVSYVLNNSDTALSRAMKTMFARAVDDGYIILYSGMSFQMSSFDSELFAEHYANTVNTHLLVGMNTLEMGRSLMSAYLPYHLVHESSVISKQAKAKISGLFEREFEHVEHSFAGLSDYLIASQDLYKRRSDETDFQWLNRIAMMIGLTACNSAVHGVLTEFYGSYPRTPGLELVYTPTPWNMARVAIMMGYKKEVEEYPASAVATPSFVDIGDLSRTLTDGCTTFVSAYTIRAQNIKNDMSSFIYPANLIIAANKLETIAYSITDSIDSIAQSIQPGTILSQDIDEMLYAAGGSADDFAIMLAEHVAYKSSWCSHVAKTNDRVYAEAIGQVASGDIGDIAMRFATAYWRTHDMEVAL